MKVEGECWISGVYPSKSNPHIPPLYPDIPFCFVYIYIYAVELITWPFFGHFRVNNLAMAELITWPSFFEPIKIGVLGDFLVHSYEGVVPN